MRAVGWLGSLPLCGGCGCGACGRGGSLLDQLRALHPDSDITITPAA